MLCERKLGVRAVPCGADAKWVKMCVCVLDDVYLCERHALSWGMVELVPVSVVVIEDESDEDMAR